MSEQFGSGQCLCGAVAYTVHSEPVRMGQCHCVDCRRASGQGHMSLAFFPEDAVKVTGETKEYAIVADSGNTNTRSFCGTCGGRLFGKNSARQGVMAISVGTFDDSSWFNPGAIVYTKDYPGEWDHMDASVPTFEMMPPG